MDLECATEMRPLGTRVTRGEGGGLIASHAAEADDGEDEARGAV